jgi:hypothetical protein
LIEVLAADAGRQALPAAPEATERAASLEAGVALFQAFEIDMTEPVASSDADSDAISQFAASLAAEPAARAE